MTATIHGKFEYCKLVLMTFSGNVVKDNVWVSEVKVNNPPLKEDSSDLFVSMCLDSHLNPFTDR